MALGRASLRQGWHDLLFTRCKVRGHARSPPAFQVFRVARFSPVSGVKEMFPSLHDLNLRAQKTVLYKNWCAYFYSGIHIWLTSEKFTRSNAFVSRSGGPRFWFFRGQKVGISRNRLFSMLRAVLRCCKGVLPGGRCGSSVRRSTVALARLDPLQSKLFLLRIATFWRRWARFGSKSCFNFCNSLPELPAAQSVSQRVSYRNKNN